MYEACFTSPLNTSLYNLLHTLSYVSSMCKASSASRTKNIPALNIKFIFIEGGFPHPAGLFLIVNIYIFLN